MNPEGTTTGEAYLVRELSALRRAIQNWAKRCERVAQFGCNADVSFISPYEHYRECPRRGSVLLMNFEGPLADIFGGPDVAQYRVLVREFDLILSERGFHYDFLTCWLIEIFAGKGLFQDKILQLYRWRWIQKLAAVRLFDVHAEVFEHFASQPDELKRIGWRDFECLLDAIFRNQGFRTELGPGKNDGGVDLRLYQSSAIGELVTLVQAKRWTTAPIKLDLVAALYGHVVHQKADAGMLVTTSRFQPKSRQFAVSADRKITLADSGHVAGWCAEVSAQLERYFQTGVLSSMLHLARDAAPGGMAGQVVVGCEGEGFEYRQFWVVAHDFPRELILRPLAQRILWANQHDGEAVPDPDGAIMDSRPKCLLAFKNEHGIEGSRWRFQRWDGTPVHLGGTD